MSVPRFCIAPALLAVLATATASVALADAKPIGFVLQESGTWNVNGKPLHRNDQLAPGSVVQLAAADAAAAPRPRIVIVLDNGHTLSCDGPDDCKTAIALPGSLDESSSLFGRIAALFKAQPDRFEPTQVRGPGLHATAHLDDTVASTAGGTADLGALLAPLGAGDDYVLSVTSLDDFSSHDITVHRSASGKAPAALTAGLYSITIGVVGTKPPLAPDVWVLAVDSADYAAVKQQFDDARAATATWPAAAGEDTRKSFLRAALQALHAPQ